MLSRLIAPLSGLLVGCTGSVATAGPNWQLAGTTYNSVAFVDLASLVADRPVFHVYAGLRSTCKGRLVECRAESDSRLRVGVFADRGTIIQQVDGTLKKYPGSGIGQKAGGTGVFHGMFEIVCGGRRGTAVTDPQAWTAKNFKLGS